MKKTIAILGSTGTIGINTINIIKRDKKSFNIILLTANSNIKLITKQAKELNVKNLVIYDLRKFKSLKKIFLGKKINIFNSVSEFKAFFKKKIDYTMCAISGLSGLKPTLESISFSREVAIANKESLICAWNLIHKELLKNKTKFIPVDSEHFSIWTLLENSKDNEIEEIILTASGGPFLNFPLKKFNSINKKMALNHPKWKMGKKISIDSSTMMNKVFEVIEAQKIFNIDINKFKILTHPDSYIHAIIKFKNGLTKLLAHDTDMKIPIFNSIYRLKDKSIKSKKLDISKLNNMRLLEVNTKKFPCVKILKKIPIKESLFETIVIAANEELVNQFLTDNIAFTKISKILEKITNIKYFVKFKKKKPRSLDEIVRLNKFVRLKTKHLCNKDM